MTALQIVLATMGATTVVVTLVGEYARRRPITPEDEYCARVDAELDAATLAKRLADAERWQRVDDAAQAQIDAARGRHPSAHPLTEQEAADFAAMQAAYRARRI